MKKEEMVSKDERILFDKVKLVIDNNPGIRELGYHAIYEKCLESDFFTDDEIRILSRSFKGDSLAQFIYKIKNFLKSGL